MKLLFFISSFQSGGAERVASILLEHWRRRGWEIVVAEWSLKDPFYTLDPAIRLLRLGLNTPPRSLAERFSAPIKRFMTLRRTIRTEVPDIIVSFMTRQNVYAACAVRGLGFPLIVSEHSLRRIPLVSPSLDFLRSCSYPIADRVVVLTRADARAYPRLRNIVVVPNPVAVPSWGLDPPRRRTILAVGRLAHEKGFDLLIEAFSRIVDRRGFSLHIAGEGEERPALETRIREGGLESEVELLGRRSDVYRLYGESSFLVLSSRYEGFGMVLVEAMACGCPVVAFDCPCGPAEVIRDGIDGLLVPAGDVAALSASMSRLMEDDALRERLGRAAPEVRDRFGVEKVGAMWDKLITAVLAEHGKD